MGFPKQCRPNPEQMPLLGFLQATLMQTPRTIPVTHSKSKDITMRQYGADPTQNSCHPKQNLFKSSAQAKVSDPKQNQFIGWG